MCLCVQFLDAIVGPLTRAHAPQITITRILETMQNVSAVKEDVQSLLPTDADGAFQLLLATYQLPLYRYSGCRECGRLKRCELKELDRCPCGAVWQPKVFCCFSLLDFLEAVFACPTLAEAMRYEDMRDRPRGEG